MAVPFYPPYSLAGRVAIVTGSSRGIGRAIAIHLAELGAKVLINYTTRSTDADQVAAEIKFNSSAGTSPVAVVFPRRYLGLKPGRVPLRRGGESL